MDESTKNLIAACRRKNRMAQRTLYARHAPRLYAVCLRITGNTADAEEAMQDAFFKILTHLDQYREEWSFEAWSKRIAIHTAIDYVRRQAPDWEELKEDYPSPVEEGTIDEHTVQYTVCQIKERMQQLPPGYRIILSLYLFEGYDVQEIAQILHIQPASVRSQYLRAKKKLIKSIATK